MQLLRAMGRHPNLLNSLMDASLARLQQGPARSLPMTYIHVGVALERAFAITVSPFLLTEELWPPTERARELPSPP